MYDILVSLFPFWMKQVWFFLSAINPSCYLNNPLEATSVKESHTGGCTEYHAGEWADQVLSPFPRHRPETKQADRGWKNILHAHHRYTEGLLEEGRVLYPFSVNLLVPSKLAIFPGLIYQVAIGHISRASSNGQFPANMTSIATLLSSMNLSQHL